MGKRVNRTQKGTKSADRCANVRREQTTMKRMGKKGVLLEQLADTGCGIDGSRRAMAHGNALRRMNLHCFLIKNYTPSVILTFKVPLELVKSKDYYEKRVKVAFGPRFKTLAGYNSYIKVTVEWMEDDSPKRYQWRNYWK
uniref:YDG domain-containing protein n=1 Tax=Panagrellus redivivus TaxID=6233 RepID=A0A7E4VBA1_PANRE